MGSYLHYHVCVSKKTASLPAHVCQRVTTLRITALFYQYGLTLISAWINKHIHYNVWDEITYHSQITMFPDEFEVKPC